MKMESPVQIPGDDCEMHLRRVGNTDTTQLVDDGIGPCFNSFEGKSGY